MLIIKRPQACNSIVIYRGGGGGQERGGGAYQQLVSDGSVFDGGGVAVAESEVPGAEDLVAELCSPVSRVQDGLTEAGCQAEG